MPRQITLSLDLLRDLIFEFPSLSDIRCQSVTDAGPETYFPRIIPKELGKVIESLNTDDLFVVFHFAHHSEIWHKAHWHDSNSRRWSLVCKANASTDSYNERARIIDSQNSKIRAIKELIIRKTPMFAEKTLGEQLHLTAVALSRMNEESARNVPIDGLYEILYPSDNSQTT